MDARAPVLIGLGQLLDRPEDPRAGREPLELMAEAAKAAAQDTARGDVLSQVDTLIVVNIVSWYYGDAPALLAERLGISPRHRFYTTIGGDTPQRMANFAADRIAAGQSDVVLIAGAEAAHTLRAFGGKEPPWTRPRGDAKLLGDRRLGSSELELRHGATLPANIYPLFENALRAARGQSLAEHRTELAAFSARLAAVAREHPCAWFRDGKDATTIGTVTAENRMIAFPYTKFMNAILDVNQGAAILMTSAERAQALGIPRERWVFLWSGAELNEPWFILEREAFHRAPAVAACAAQALERAGLAVSDIELFDLYSCFPCAPRITMEMIGIPAGDPRPVTVTGGLPYFGGPGSNYSLHAIATMAERLRSRPEAKGLVHALGWYMTKHAMGIYGAGEPPRPWPVPRPSAQADTDALPRPPLAERAEGRATVETYTVVHDRGGAPASATIIGRLEDGRRFIATGPADRATLEAMESAELVGRPGRVRHDRASDVNVLDPA